MLDNAKIIQIAYHITSTFEGGSYSNVTGNFDKMGLSLGLCQWNPGTGSLQKLLQTYIAKYGDEAIPAYFHGIGCEDVLTPLAHMTPETAVPFIVGKVIDTTSRNQWVQKRWVSPLAAFMSSADMVVIQNQIFEQQYIQSAKKMLDRFVPNALQSYRAAAFFVDVAVQNGSMKTVALPWGQGDSSALVAYLQQMKKPTALSMWQPIWEKDEMALFLSHLALRRSQLARKEYQWDVFNRKTTIATKIGNVHAAPINLTGVIPD